MATAKKQIKIKVGNFGKPTKEVKIKSGATLNDLVEKLDLSSAASKGQVLVNGSASFPGYKMKNGDFIQIISNKEGGIK